MALKISDEAKVQMPMKTVVSLIVIVALGTMGYFQIVERLNVADTRLQLMEKDLEENTEFRICLLYTSPSPRDLSTSRMPSSA